MKNYNLMAILGLIIGVLQITSCAATSETEIENKIEFTTEEKNVELKPIAQQTTENSTKPNLQSNQTEILKVMGMQVIESIKNWIHAWENQDLPTYFSYYANSFEPAEQRTREEWENFRKSRIMAPNKITIVLSQLNINFSNITTANVSFMQEYRADKKRFRTNKILKMVLENNIWKIQKENNK